MKSQSNDAINLLTKDHKEVKILFQQYEGLTDASHARKKKIANEICQALTLHAQVEEEIFYPAVRRAFKDAAMMDEALVEHASAKELIVQIENMYPDDELYDAKIKVLSEQIDHHVHEEEHKMFPKVRQSGLDLNSLGEQIMARKEKENV